MSSTSSRAKACESILASVAGFDHARWGWVIYRTSFRADLDASWARLRDYADGQATRRAIASSDAPELLDKMKWEFVEDRALEGATPWELQTRFRSWVDATLPVEQPNPVPVPVCGPNGMTYEMQYESRFKFFIFVDEEALQSIAQGVAQGVPGGWVNIFDGEWDRSLSSSEDEEDCDPVYGCRLEELGFKKMTAGMVCADFYEELEPQDCVPWYALLPLRPPDVNYY